MAVRAYEVYTIDAPSSKRAAVPSKDAFSFLYFPFPFHSHLPLISYSSPSIPKLSKQTDLEVWGEGRARGGGGVEHVEWKNGIGTKGSDGGEEEREEGAMHLPPWEMQCEEEAAKR